MYNTNKEIDTINVKQVINGKSPKLAKRIPNFVINLIRRLIHEDELNYILKEYSSYSGVEFSMKVVKYLNKSVHFKYIDKESIKNGERYIFVSNHPLGGLDGLILISEIGKQFGNVKFVVNDFLMNVAPLKSIFVPVNKVGKMNRDYACTIDKLYESENQIIYFPAGLCSRLIEGKITDLEWQTNFYKKAFISGRKIVPINFSGRNSMFFYRLAKLRKFLGIKFNVEMIFLPNEMFKQRSSDFNVTIGTPIEPQIWSDRDDLREKCDNIRGVVYNMQKNNCL